LAPWSGDFSALLERKGKPVPLLIIRSVVKFLFLSMIGTKLPNCILPVCIPLTTGIARVLRNSLPDWRKYITAGHVGLLIYGAAAVIAGALMLGSSGGTPRGRFTT